MKNLKHYVSIVFMLIVLLLLAFNSCKGKDDDLICKVSVVSGEGGTATTSDTEVMSGWEVTLTATPEATYRFVNWTVNGEEVSRKNPYTATVTTSTQFKANFEKDNYKVTVIAGEGGTAEASKTQAGHNEEITLTATPQEGYSFVNWTVNGEEVSTDNPYTITVTGDKEYQANFKEQKASTPTDPISSLSYEELVYVEGGTFTMGATSEQGSDYTSYERPTHQVTLTSYYIGKYEVTQQLWEYVMSYSGTAADGTTMTAYSSDVWLGDNPWSGEGLGNYYPAYYVSYNDIVNIFLPRLNKITGNNYRLPTEAEWEYAARGGNKSQGYKYSGSNTIDDVAWYYGNSGYTTHTVGTKQANELGIYDMSGNVSEWCSDWFSSSYYSSSPQTNPTGPTSGSYRVFRGGAGYSYADFCRVSRRGNDSLGTRSRGKGFRLALGLKP